MQAETGHAGSDVQLMDHDQPENALDHVPESVPSCQNEEGPQQQPMKVIASKGELLGGGVTGIVELMEDGNAIKSPWPDDKDSYRDMDLEARIYQHLGAHPRLVKVIDWDAERHCLTMEYMSNGTLRKYIEKQNSFAAPKQSTSVQSLSSPGTISEGTHVHATSISMTQLRRWALQAAEGLSFLHSKDVMHCDFTPGNLLLDSDLRVKVADFGCSSLHGSKSSGVAGVRYHATRRNTYGHESADLTTEDFIRYDIFALGSTLYAIMTGHDPYQDVDSENVCELFGRKCFPDDLRGMYLGEIVESCWNGTFKSVEEVLNAIEECEPPAEGSSKFGSLQVTFRYLGELWGWIRERVVPLSHPSWT